MGVSSVIFRAMLDVGGAGLPVKFYAAVQDRRVHFRLLDEADVEPVAQQMVDAETEEPVERDEIQRGYEVEPGRFVILHPEELEGLTPKSDRHVRVLRVIPRAELEPAWIERPYFLGPDGKPDDYFALAKALEDRAAIVHWVMRKRSYVGALVSDGGYLMIMTLRSPGEVVVAPPVSVPKGSLDKKQLELAHQLVETLRGEFEPTDYEDDYRLAVDELVARKAAGKKVKRLKRRKRPETDNLARALRASLSKAKEKHVA